MNKIEYEDNYIENIKNYSAFTSVVSYLACHYDYIEKISWKLDTVDSLKEKLSIYDYGMFSNFDQKFNNISFQNPFIR